MEAEGGKPDVTPRLSQHARDRCKEMGIPTKRAKRVVQNRVLTWKGNTDTDTDTLIVVSSDQDIAVVWRPSNNTIVTVLPRTKDDYKRTRNGFEVIT